MVGSYEFDAKTLKEKLNYGLAPKNRRNLNKKINWEFNPQKIFNRKTLPKDSESRKKNLKGKFLSKSINDFKERKKELTLDSYFKREKKHKRKQYSSEKQRKDTKSQNAAKNG